jgi:pimeloyl-ACP methyl ester carboxylesterase
MRKILALTLLFTVACLRLPAQQIPAAIDIDPPADKAYPAAMQSFQLPSHGALLNALMYTAAGAGPHRIVVLLHGFPGNEKNLDLAQTLRRAGWDVLYFNYRGSWGSPGDFSFTHSTEDVAASLAYLREPANAAKFRADPAKIVLIGHSMGGFMAAYEGAHDPSVTAVGLISAADMGGMGVGVASNSKLDTRQKTAEIAARLAEEGLAPLSGCTPESLANELLQPGANFAFDRLAAGLSKHPVLLISSDDGLAGMSTSLAEALRQDGDKRVDERHFATDHLYSDKRIALETAVLGWLATLP